MRRAASVLAGAPSLAPRESGQERAAFGLAMRSGRLHWSSRSLGNSPGRCRWPSSPFSAMRGSRLMLRGNVTPFSTQELFPGVVLSLRGFPSDVGGCRFWHTGLEMRRRSLLGGCGRVRACSRQIVSVWSDWLKATATDHRVLAVSRGTVSEAATYARTSDWPVQAVAIDLWDRAGTVARPGQPDALGVRDRR